MIEPKGAACPFALLYLNSMLIDGYVALVCRLAALALDVHNPLAAHRLR